MVKILVVEDEGIVALDICEELKALGYEIAGHAVTGKQAVEFAEKLNPDLIFMDINLRDEIDGIQAAEIINKRKPTPIIFLTAHAEEQTLQRAKLVNPFGYIIKPFEQDELRVAVELAQARVLSSGAAAEVEAPAMEEVLLEGTPAEITLQAISSMPIFHGMAAAKLQPLAQASFCKDLDAGQYFEMQSDRARYGVIVLSGRIAVTKSLESGKELIVELLAPHDMTGILFTLDEHPDYLLRAQVDAKVVGIPSKQLLDLLEEERTLYPKMLALSATRGRRLTDLALGLAHSKVEHRIIAALLNLAPQIGKGTKTTGDVRIFITRRELADLTGTTPETAIRVTKALERQNLLDLTRPGIIKVPSIQLLAEALH